MKYLNHNILLLIFILISDIIGEERKNKILNIAYNKGQSLPDWNTLYFSKNEKCNKAKDTPFLCILDNSLYIVKETEYINILTIDEYNSNFYYELNVMRIIDTTKTEFIITYMKDKKEIIFLYYEFNIDDNQYVIKANNYLNIESHSPINCQKQLDTKLICFFRSNNKKIIKVEFNYFFYYFYYNLNIIK